MKKRIFWTIFLTLFAAIISAGAVSAYIFRNEIKGFFQPHKHAYVLTEEVAATCTNDGHVVKICSCGEKETETIPATGHTEEVVPGYAAECDKDGLLDGLKCATCGEVFTEQEIIPALGHNVVEGNCDRCDYVDLSALWTVPASEGYSVDGNKLTFSGTNELTFATKQQYSSVTLTFNVSETQDVRGAFQIGWGAQSQNTSINDLPFVQFNYDRAVLCLPDGTTYDTSWLTGKSWKLTIDAENNKVILSVDGEVVYNVDASWWTKEGWGLPGYLILRAESNCALTFELTEMLPN